MTNASVALFEYWRKLGLELDQDFLQPGLPLLTLRLIEQEVTQQIGVAKHARRSAKRSAMATGRGPGKRAWVS